MIGQADDQYHAHHHDDHLLPVDKLSAKGIAEEAERQLTDDVADVGSRVDGTAQEERVGWSLDRWFGEAAPVFVGPYRGDQVDDEQIVGVEEETDTVCVSGFVVSMQHSTHPQMANSLRSPRVMIRPAPVGLCCSSYSS